MQPSRFASVLVLAAMLCSCGGDSGGSSGTLATTPTPTVTSGTCSLRNRQDWALATLNEWYLYPETLPASLDPTPYATVSDYIDALTATARGQGRDRYFTYLTSIAQENAFNSSGATAGFGIRLGFDSTTNRLFIIEAYEGAPALAAGIDRGDEIVAIGNDTASLRTVSDIVAGSGTTGLNDALGLNTAGTTRILRISGASGTRVVSVAKADYALTPVSSRYGAKVITDNGQKIGYLNLRTFISSADPQLQSAFADFKTQGITSFVIDFRYNGGGLVSTAELLGDLLGGNRRTSDVFSQTTFRPSKSSNNATKTFAPTASSVSPVKVAFIGTGSTASASELVINAFVPYLGNNMALIGANTYGKPVGQIAIDRAACDDRLRVIAFSLKNGAGTDNYYSGLASVIPVTCKAGDDISRPLGDAGEASVRAALDFIAGKSCATKIAGVAQTSASVRTSVPAGATAAVTPAMGLLQPEAPDTPQRAVPGTY